MLGKLAIFQYVLLGPTLYTPLVFDSYLKYPKEDHLHGLSPSQPGVSIGRTF